MVRSPIEIRGSQQPVGQAGDSNGIVPFDRGDDRADRYGGTLALSWLSFTTTNGVDFTTVTRSIELALVDGSGKIFTAAPNVPPLNTVSTQSILFAGTVATLWQEFQPLPIPRDVAGELFMRLRWRVRARLNAPDWTIRAGLVELFSEAR
ncbi:MAG: hypothetical protein GTO30_05930 [Acidobacteria bacterium]|nr:hypothetical protein [Acidobacteriota bacterium]